MLRWLATRGENARVYMCIKEVKWDLETADTPRRAMLLANAQRFRLEMLDEDKAGLAPSYFDLSRSHSRADLFKIYEVFETIRNNMNYQYEQIQKRLARIGVMLPAYAVEHSKNINRGLEVRMCTLGSGIVPDRHDDVRKIWMMLSEGLPLVPEAIRRLQEIAESMATFTGASNPTDMFDEQTIPKLLAAADFVPSAFRRGGATH
jgi:hypothetical protein